MKGTHLGEFEELVLLTVGVLDGNAYGVSIGQAIEEKMKRSITISTVHTVLYRLEEKGFVQSEFGGSTRERGGRKKRLYTITAAGYKALTETRALRDQMWNLMPKFSF